MNDPRRFFVRDPAFKGACRECKEPMTCGDVLWTATDEDGDAVYWCSIGCAPMDVVAPPRLDPPRRKSA